MKRQPKTAGSTNAAPPGSSASRYRLTRPKLKGGWTREDDTAYLLTEGLAANALALMEYSTAIGGRQEIGACFAQVLLNAEAIEAGDLGSVESILAAQIVSLNSIFTEVALLARANFKHSDHFDRLLRLALRAQSGCRATAESLVFLKSPTGAVFAKQANISQGGPQQVNNGITAPAGSRTGNLESRPIKLLEAPNGERLDTGTTGAAGASDSQLAPVDPVHRATKRGRKNTSRP